ncbi:MAG: NADH-quinone oxidoreductase subunit NuoF [Elusimicrobia bacterium]|nr:NADH-quinone oxidoreductase subunit NuoF [Elusimicrobiota bacterium]
MNNTKKLASISEFENLANRCISAKSKDIAVISVCCGTGCTASGALDVLARLREEIEKRKLDTTTDTLFTGCHGFCERGPLVVIRNLKGNKNIFYQQVKPEDVAEIISETVLTGKIIGRLLYIDPTTKNKIISEEELPFYKNQKRLLFGSNGKIDPTSIEYYIAIGGYSALGKVLTSMTPQRVIEEIKKSGLRGRGGAGFPTGRKWESCRKAVGDSPNSGTLHTTGYVICNADEGDPGAFMDRSLLEGNPHSVLEGMIIGAYTIGVKLGYIYVRNEYPLAVKHFSIALQQAREHGLLGENILGTDLSFDIKINRGAGAFVCGESSALRASIEGRVGEPSVKYIHATEKGLYNMPTVLNNVKTWASVPLIINNGADWFSSIGTEKSKGTMIFSLVGKINNTGLVEVPMGITLREMIYNIGGGIPGGKKFKAVQTGGPSGGCIPEKLLDLPVDYEALTQAGSMMGSGGMIVMDEDTCMVEVARYFLAFTQDESCGKCTPCREGTKHMLKILTNITKGKGREGDIELLEEIGNMVKDTALCALGNSAPNPALTTIKYFRDEYESHINQKKCPAKVCKSLIKYSVITDKCNGCHLCFVKCPEKAITGTAKKPHIIIREKCVKCGICFDVCKQDAIKIE